MSAALLRSAAAPLPKTTASASRWAGRIISGIVIVLLAFDAAVKRLRVPAAVEGTAQLGYPPEALPIIGVLALVCLVLYVIPRTAPLGAILWTGYFGGTVATHLRAGNPLFTHILSGVYVATLVWVGLYLRDERVKGLLRK